MLGHGHADHRGAAPGLGVPVCCHADDKADAEGDGGVHYFRLRAPGPRRRAAAAADAQVWDGGPVEIAGTVAEGDEIAGFRVDPPARPRARADRPVARVRPPRADERLLLHARPADGHARAMPRVPHAAFNQDTEQARASIRKLAALEPAAAWPGHADPLRGDVAASC